MREPAFTAPLNRSRAEEARATTVSDSTKFTRPAERYGAARRPVDKSNRRTGRAVILAVLFVAIVTVVLFAQFISQREDADVTASMTNFERVEDDTLAMSIDVTRDDVDKPSYCIVTALNYDKAEVGRRDVVIPAGGPETQRIDVEITTRDLPVSGSVYGCSTNMPAFLEH